MILDIYKEGCTIWIGENVTSIKGSPVEICREIYMRSVVDHENRSGQFYCDQIYEIGIDIAGPYGVLYRNILSDMGLKTYDIRAKHIDTILPIRTENVAMYPQMCIDDIYRFKF